MDSQELLKEYKSLVWGDVRAFIHNNERTLFTLEIEYKHWNSSIEDGNVYPVIGVHVETVGHTSPLTWVAERTSFITHKGIRGKI